MKTEALGLDLPSVQSESLLLLSALRPVRSGKHLAHAGELRRVALALSEKWIRKAGCRGVVVGARLCVRGFVVSSERGADVLLDVFIGQHKARVHRRQRQVLAVRGVRKRSVKAPQAAIGTFRN